MMAKGTTGHDLGGYWMFLHFLDLIEAMDSAWGFTISTRLC